MVQARDTAKFTLVIHFLGVIPHIHKSLIGKKGQQKTV